MDKEFNKHWKTFQQSIGCDIDCPESLKHSIQEKIALNAKIGRSLVKVFYRALKEGGYKTKWKTWKIKDVIVTNKDVDNIDIIVTTNILGKLHVYWKIENKPDDMIIHAGINNRYLDGFDSDASDEENIHGSEISLALRFCREKLSEGITQFMIEKFRVSCEFKDTLIESMENRSVLFLKIKHRYVQLCTPLELTLTYLPSGL